MTRQELAVGKRKSEIEYMKHQVIEGLKAIRDERSKFAAKLEKNTQDIETIKNDMDKTAQGWETRNEQTLRLLQHS